ncbi:MAG: hypothetical protein AB8E15_08745 [Bdellovibrionales bacterium]
MSDKKLVDETPIYFDPSRAGKSLYEVKQDVLNSKTKKVVSRWYTGYRETDFFTWEDLEGHIVKAQLTYCGQVFEWNIVEGNKSGFVLVEEDQDDSKNKINTSELIQYDSSLNQHAFQTAVELIESLQNIDEAQKTQLLSLIQKNITIDNMGQKDFWDHYGYSGVSYSPSKIWMGFHILGYYFKKWWGKYFNN